MKNLIIIFIILFSGYNLLSQNALGKINLNHYKLPDYKYRSLNMDFFFGGGGTIHVKGDDFVDNSEGQGQTKLRLSPYYFAEKNSRKKQFRTFKSIVLEPGFRLDKRLNEDVKNKLYIKFIARDNTERKYYVSKKIFFENDFSLNFINEIKTDIQGDTGTISNVLNLKIPLLIGFGRMENITSSWHAIRIIEDLDHSGLLIPGSSFSTEDVFALADYITQSHFTRAFDYREKWKSDVIGLANTLLKNRVDFTNPMAYASLFDMWRYGVNAYRRSGATYAIGVVPGFRYLDINKHNEKAFDLFLLNRFEYARALSTKWQFDLLLELQAGLKDLLLYRRGSDEDPSDNVKYGAKSFLNIGIGYYPNTRTYFTSTIYLLGNVTLFDDGDDGALDQSFNFANNLYYYINPRNRLNFYFVLGDNYNVYRGSNYPYSGRFNLKYGIKYSLAIL